MKAKHADSLATNSARTELVEGFTKLGNVVDSRVSQTGPQGRNDFVYVDIGSIDNEKKLIESPKTLSVDDAPSRAKQLLEVGDVVVSMTRPNLNAIAQITSELASSIGSTGFDVLRANRKLVAPNWIYYNLQTSRFIEEMCALVQGALYPAVRSKDIRNFEIRLPPLPTQHRIVAEIEEKLSRLDAAQSALLRAQTNLKRYRASILAKACDGTLVGADSSTWLSTTLGALATKIRNGFSAKPDADHGTRIFRISAVRPLALGLDEVRYLSGDIAEYSAFTVEPGDLLFTRYNGNSEFVGACALVPHGCPPTVYPDKLIKVQLPKAKVIPEFAAIQASSGVTRSFIESRIRTTAGQSGISGSDIKATPILLPTVKIQHQIVEEVDRRLSVIDRTEQTLRTQLERAKRLRQSILQQAFKG